MNYGLYLYKDLTTGERLEILKRGYAGGGQPIQAITNWSWMPRDNDSAEVLDNPIIKSTLSLNLKDMGGFDYSVFYTVDATLWRVVLKSNGVQRWSGYVSPESFSSNSEYRSDINIMAVDNLGQLEQEDYNMFESPFISLRKLMTSACALIGWNFNPIIFETGLISSNGIMVEDALLNVEAFRENTWWEVLEVVLTSYGCQLSFYDDNTYKVVNVSNKVSQADIAEIPGCTLEGGATTEIIPPWRELVIKRDYQILKNFYKFPQYNDYEAINTRSIYAYNGKYRGIPGIPLSDWSLRYVDIDNLKPNTWSKNGDFVLLSGKSIEGCNEDAMYIHTVIKTPDETSYVAKTVVIPNISSGITIEVSVGNSEYSVLWEWDPSNTSPEFPFIASKAIGLSPYGGTFDIDYYFQVLFNYIDSEGVNRYLILKEQWEKLTEGNANYKIKLSVTHAVNNEIKDESLFINIDSLPSAGYLEFRIFRPKLANPEGIVSSGADSLCRISDVKSYPYPKPKIGSVSNKVNLNTKARTKKDVELLFGEIPKYASWLDYAGGLFGPSPYYDPIIGWKRTDDIGGVLPLQELVGRAYVHSVSGITTAAGEATGGKIMRATFFAKGLKVNNILKLKSVEGDELYAINSVRISQGKAQLTLRQVRPYKHHDYFSLSPIDAGGGSTIGGGGQNVQVAWSSQAGNPKRIYELGDTSSTFGLYTIADSSQLEEAVKVPLDDLGIWHLDRETNTVTTEYNAKVNGWLTVGSADGGNGSGSGGGGDPGTVGLHASTHAAGGTDSVTPENIGAAPSSHSHTASDIGAAPENHSHKTGDISQLEEFIGRVATELIPPPCAFSKTFQIVKLADGRTIVRSLFPLVVNEWISVGSAAGLPDGGGGGWPGGNVMHAHTHAIGGDDPITASYIGAAPSIHSHKTDDINGFREYVESLISKPMAMTLDYPRVVTMRNPAEQRIKYALTPTNTGRNVLFIGDDNAVSVFPDGEFNINKPGISKIHVIPTENTTIYKTVKITVVEPAMRKVKANSLRFDGSGNIRLT